jgi:cytochrome c biogenesis protein CcmG/thiol:disulfide interchange protein DsbE
VKRLMCLFFLLMAVSLVSCSRGDDRAKKSSLARTEDTAPDFVLKDTEGKNVQLSRFRGKVVVVEFWATWCPPCKATIPGLIALQEKYTDKGLVVLGISIDEGDDLASKLSAFSKEHKINYPILIGTEEVARAYGVMSIPATFLIGRDQKIISAYKGYVEDIESLISEQIERNL